MGIRFGLLVFRRVYHSRVLCLQNIVKSNRQWFLKIICINSADDISKLIGLHFY